MSKPAVVQSVGLDPKELFDPSSYPTPTYLRDKFTPLVTTLGSALVKMSYNWSYKRPFFAGAQQFPVVMLIGLGVGVWWQRRSDLYYAERDAIYRHYIELHPEDFKPQERIVIGDMFKPWLPIR